MTAELCELMPLLMFSYFIDLPIKGELHADY